MSRHLFEFMLPPTKYTLAAIISVSRSESDGWNDGPGTPRLPWLHHIRERKERVELHDFLIGNMRVILGRELP